MFPKKIFKGLNVFINKFVTFPTFIYRNNSISEYMNIYIYAFNRYSINRILKHSANTPGIYENFF